IFVRAIGGGGALSVAVSFLNACLIYACLIEHDFGRARLRCALDADEQIVKPELYDELISLLRAPVRCVVDKDLTAESTVLRATNGFSSAVAMLLATSPRHADRHNSWKATRAGDVTQLKDDLDRLTWNPKLQAEVLESFDDLKPFHPGGAIDQAFNAAPTTAVTNAIKEALDQKRFRITDEDFAKAIAWGYTVEIPDHLLASHKVECKKTREKEKEEPQAPKPSLYWRVYLPSFPPPHWW
ncbi:hypothetical protein JCM5296_005609, partial [Sporobolomyces johnsonii]